MARGAHTSRLPRRVRHCYTPREQRSTARRVADRLAEGEGAARGCSTMREHLRKGQRELGLATVMDEDHERLAHAIRLHASRSMPAASPGVADRAIADGDRVRPAAKPEVHRGARIGGNLVSRALRRSCSWAPVTCSHSTTPATTPPSPTPLPQPSWPVPAITGSRPGSTTPQVRPAVRVGPTVRPMRQAGLRLVPTAGTHALK